MTSRGPLQFKFFCDSVIALKIVERWVLFWYEILRRLKIIVLVPRGVFYLIQLDTLKNSFHT